MTMDRLPPHRIRRDKKNLYILAPCPQCGVERWARNSRLSKICRGCYYENLHNSHGHSWKGGISVRSTGYVFIYKPEHPFSHKSGYIQRSHLVAEESLGRYLLPNECTHHKNGVVDDDSPENIEVLINGQHTALHNRDLGKAKHMGLYRHKKLENEWIGIGIPTIGQKAQGNILGHKRNGTYEYTCCSQCLTLRWVNISNSRRATTTSCHVCSATRNIEEYNRDR